MPLRGAAIRGGDAGNEGHTVTAEPTLNDAHRLLREGQGDSAIDAYTALLKDRPDNWITANRLGDLYVQTGQLDAAVEQFSHVAHCLVERDLLPKAAALYKKVLKVTPGDEATRSQLVDLALRQGFLVEAIGHLTAMAKQRRATGDDAGGLKVQHGINSLRRPASEANDVAPTEQLAMPTLPTARDTHEETRRPARPAVQTRGTRLRTPRSALNRQSKSGNSNSNYS